MLRAEHDLIPLVQAVHIAFQQLDRLVHVLAAGIHKHHVHLRADVVIHILAQRERAGRSIRIYFGQQTIARIEQARVIVVERLIFLFGHVRRHNEVVRVHLVQRRQQLIEQRRVEVQVLIRRRIVVNVAVQHHAEDRTANVDGAQGHHVRLVLIVVPFIVPAGDEGAQVDQVRGQVILGQPHIFQRFLRVAPSLAPHAGGNGV